MKSYHDGWPVSRRDEITMTEANGIRPKTGDASWHKCIGVLPASSRRWLKFCKPCTGVTTKLRRVISDTVQFLNHGFTDRMNVVREAERQSRASCRQS